MEFEDRRGFRSFSPQRRREISSKAGKRAHKLKKAHRWTSEQAIEAGRKGGLEASRRRKQIKNP